jgi:hypothetical protein
MAYKILESSSASFSIFSSSNSVSFSASLRISIIATHSNKDALEVVK